jgi:hypothetical protein
LLGGGALGATAALVEGALPSWHPLHASSESEKSGTADQRIISSTWNSR